MPFLMPTPHDVPYYETQNVMVNPTRVFDYLPLMPYQDATSEGPLLPPPSPPAPPPPPKPVPRPLAEIRFDTARYQVNDAQGLVLLETLPTTGWRYQVTAAADPRGTRDYNRWLSAKRAHAVTTFLQTHGYAVTPPVAVGQLSALPSQWPRARRAIIVGYAVSP